MSDEFMGMDLGTGRSKKLPVSVRKALTGFTGVILLGASFACGTWYQGYKDVQKVEQTIKDHPKLHDVLWNEGLFVKQGYVLEFEGNVFTTSDNKSLRKLLDSSTPEEQKEIVKKYKTRGVTVKDGYSVDILNGRNDVIEYVPR